MESLKSKTINIKWKKKIFSLLLVISILTLFLSISFAEDQTSDPIKSVTLETTNIDQESITHCKLNETVIVKAIVTDPEDSEDAYHKYYYKTKNETEWTVIKEWSFFSEVYWKPSAEGVYSIKVESRTENATSVEASKTINGFIVSDLQLEDKVTSVKLDVLPTSPVLKGTKVTMTANASGDAAVEYRFSKKFIDDNMVEGEWIVIQDWTLDNVLPRFSKDCKGQMLFKVEAKTVNSAPQTCHEDVVGYIFRGSMLSGDIQSISFNFSGNSILKGNKLTIKAQASYKSGYTGTPLYKYWAKKNDSEWKMIGDWTPNNTIEWMPEDIGEYEVCVQARTKEQLENKIEAYVYTANLTVTQPVEKLDGTIAVAVTTKQSSPQEKNRPIDIIAEATQNKEQIGNCLFKFIIKDKSLTEKLLKDWSNSDSVVWTPQENGKYEIVVEAKRLGSAQTETSTKMTYYIQDIIKTDVNSIELNIKTNKMWGEPQSQIEFEALPSGVSQDLVYQMKYSLITVEKNNIKQSDWINIGNEQTSNKWTWTIVDPYKDNPNITKVLVSFEVQEKSQDKMQWQSYDYIDNFGIINLKRNNIDSINFVDLSIKNNSATDTFIKDKELGLSAISQGAVNEQYKFVYTVNEGGITTIQDWSVNKSAKFKPSKAGIYEFAVYAKAKGASDIEGVKRKIITVLDAQPERVVSNLKLITEPVGGQVVNKTIKLVAKYKKVDKSDKKVFYQFWVKNGSDWTALNNVPGEMNEIDYVTNQVGEADFRVAVFGENSNVEAQANAYLKDYLIYKDDVLFTDVTEKHWAYNEILSMAKKGIVQGMGSNMFKPNSNVTREQFAKMMVSSLKIGLQENAATPNYTDVVCNSNANWAWSYILKADKYLGKGGSIFEPKKSATRFEIAEALVKFSEEKYGSIDVSGFNPNDYSEFIKNTLSEEQKTIVAKVISAGIMQGYMNKDGTYSFNLNKGVTRAEAAAVLYRMSLKYRY